MPAKLLLANVTANVIALGLQALDHATAGAVQRDGDGVPVAWRLFKFGPFSITRNGETADGAFTAEHGARIMEHYQKKGNKIPIDAEHGLYLLARNLNAEEGDIAKLLGKPSATLGFGALALKADGLWIEDVEWGKLARGIISQGVLRWFSPVLRGLVDGQLRITSVALTNTPAIDQLNAIAATAEDDCGMRNAECGMKSEIRNPKSEISFAGEHGSHVPPGVTKRAVLTPAVQKGASMKGLLALLGAIIGLSETDSAALTAEGAESALLPKLQDLTTELGKLRKDGALAKDVRDALALGAEVEPAAVTGKLAGILAKAQQHDTLKTRVDALELTAETGKKDKLIADGLAAGKLTPDLVEKWAKKQDAAALSAFLDNAPVIVPQGRTDKTKLPTEDTAVLSAEDLEMCKVTGQDPEKVKAAWKKHQENK
jgi:phage I-like protein